MFRSIITSLAKSKRARNIVTHWKVARRFATRFVAGETLESAIAVTRDLNARGIQTTLDHLGENTLTAEAAGQATEEILGILDAIEKDGARANVSVKLSQIGLALDEKLCEENLRRIVDRASVYHNFIRIDMEDSTLTEKTLQAYWKMRDAGFDNLGIAIQAYLFRSEADVRRLVERGGKVRLCKGAYLESPTVAFKKKSEVNENYDLLTRLLLEGEQAAGAPGLSTDGRTPPIPGLATHDETRVAYAQGLAKQMNLPAPAVEFQMLYGIRRELQDELVKQGHSVRIYVPFGTYWYPYFMRRLAERPANLWFFVSNLARR